MTNHAGADGRIVDALVAAGVRGLVVAGTGHGLDRRAPRSRLARALIAARACACGARAAALFGPVLPKSVDDDEAAGELSAVQARVALQLALLDESAN